MSAVSKTLLRSLLTPFYRENGGLILFLLFIMFAAVGRANETGLLEYHYALILGMLSNADMLLLVFFAWILYALRAFSFVSRTLRDPAFIFLSEYARLGKPMLYARLLLLQVLLFLPVLSYAVIIVAIALRLHLTVKAAVITGVLAGLCVGPAAAYTLLFARPGLFSSRGWRTGVPVAVFRYRQVLQRYIISRKKTLFFVIKLFSAGILWGVLRQLSPGDQDLRMPVLFFSFGLFGHSVLLFACRGMEDQHLGFYPGLPVSLMRRFAGYALFYGLIFFPETLLLIAMTPDRLSPGNSLSLFGLGYGILLLMNSILFVKSFKKADFLKCCCGIFLFVFIGVLAGMLTLIIVAILLAAVWLFFRYYYRYEPTPGQR